MRNDHQKADRCFIVISDIEMSCGGQIDDFKHPHFLRDFILQYNQGVYEQLEVDLVFNGDTFDFLKTTVDEQSPHLIDEDAALRKLAIFEKAHEVFFEAIKEFLAFEGKQRRVHFITGNHDQELLFPQVQDRIIALCGNSGQIFFPGFQMRVGDMRIEHGSQKDDLFTVAPEKPFIEYKGKQILNLPWTSVTIVNAFIPYREEFAGLDRIKPKMDVFVHIPQFKEWMMSRLWSYWTNDYIKDYLKSSDPLKKISWSMIKEAFKRSLFFNPDLEMTNRYVKHLESLSDTRLLIIGHGHEPKIVGWGNKKMIQSSCFRDEFIMDKTGTRFTPIPKSYIEVLFKDNRVLTSNLLEVTGPEIDAQTYPLSMSEYAKIIDEKLKEMKKVEQVQMQESTSGISFPKIGFMDKRRTNNDELPSSRQ